MLQYIRNINVKWRAATQSSKAAEADDEGGLAFDDGRERGE